MESSNSLTHIIAINDKSNNLKIEIKLADDCKNGHEDFSITATYWEPGRVRSDRNMIGGGCCHDLILATRPDLQIFVDLHLADFNGLPMYYAANGFYHLSRMNREKFMQYYQLEPSEYEQLLTAANETHYAYICERIGLLGKWKNKALKAIKQLEEWTGKTFASTSKNTHQKAYDFTPYAGKSDAEIHTIEATAKADLYKAKADAKRAKILAEYTEATRKAATQRDIEIAVLDGVQTLNTNFLYYTHSNTLVFNWQDYGDQFTEAQVENFKNYFGPTDIIIKIGK